VSDDLDPKQQWTQIPGAAPGWEVNWDGEFRVQARKSAAGRPLPAQDIATTVGKDDYVRVKYRNAQGERVTDTVQSVMLKTFAGECPPGQECRHLDDVGTHNFWRPGTEEESRARGGNLFYGTKADQYRDKVRNGLVQPPPEPQYPCRNQAGGCANRVTKEDRRCQPCVAREGREIADRLRQRENLVKEASARGYSTKWAYRIAKEYGGYTGSFEEALRQRRRWWQRSPVTVRGRSSSAPAQGDAPSRRGGGETPGAGALRAVSPPKFPGQSRTNSDLNVAERDHPTVTERSHFPYPSELVAKRDERTRRGTGRSR
jgi:hypothetical protein